MDANDIERTRDLTLVELVEYRPGAVAEQPIIRKPTGSVSILSFDAGQGLTPSTSPFEAFVQIIEGACEVEVDGTPHLLKTGHGMILPAHRATSFRSNERCKLIRTVIKSGYE